MSPICRLRGQHEQRAAAETRRFRRNRRFDRCSRFQWEIELYNPLCRRKHDEVVYQAAGWATTAVERAAGWLTRVEGGGQKSKRTSGAQKMLTQQQRDT